MADFVMAESATREGLLGLATCTAVPLRDLSRVHAGHRSQLLRAFCAPMRLATAWQQAPSAPLCAGFWATG
jgi:hypothetical protein